MIQDGTNIFNVFSFGASPELSTNMGESSISLSYGRCVPVKKKYNGTTDFTFEYGFVLFAAWFSIQMQYNTQSAICV